MSIYRPCDIRGPVSELAPDLYRRWGQALGLLCKPGDKFIAGGDTRQSTPAFLAALLEGLGTAGLDVVAVGQLPTPMIYHAKSRLRAMGCAIVTASHHPADQNGLKWIVGDRPPTPDDITELQRSATSDAGVKVLRKPSAARELDVSFDYVANMQENFVESMGATLHIAIDAMHGAWAGKVRRYLHAVFPQCLFTVLRDEAEPLFAGETPNCSNPAGLGRLAEEVYRERAHLGVAFDGDGDRLALVDDEGVVLTPEEATAVLLLTFGERLRGGKFVHDGEFADSLLGAAREWGAVPIGERSGHTFLRRRMLDEEALFGAETSGHYYYEALDGGDDAFYSACRVIAHVARAGTSLSALRRQAPPAYITPDLRLPMPIDQQAAVLERIREAWADFPQTDHEGVRIETPAGWILVRPSVSEAALTFRMESIDWAALDDLVERFCRSLSDRGGELRNQYRSAIGTLGR